MDRGVSCYDDFIYILREIYPDEIKTNSRKLFKKLMKKRGELLDTLELLKRINKFEHTTHCDSLIKKLKSDLIKFDETTDLSWYISL